MSETVFLKILDVLLAAFPAFGALLSRWIPEDEDEPLVVRIRELLPIEGASAAARKLLEQDEPDDEITVPGE
jgi:hypothetical protein